MAEKHKTKKLKLLLISPKNEIRNMWTLKEIGVLMNRSATTTPLALPTLAAITPDNYDIKIIDEEIDPVPFNYSADIVGITAMATNISRAYEIADRFRKNGTTVIMGGPFATLSYEESLDHSDSVVIGEAEEIWGPLLKDFEKNKLKKIYQADRLSDIKKMPIPRWDLVNLKEVLTLNVQVSRGCPNDCEFCCVSKMFGRKQRFRHVDNVIEEIKSLPIKQLSFVDDNFTINKKYTKELMEKLKPLEVQWFCLASLDVADDEDLLKDMAEAGCHSILIGFETLDIHNLKETNKSKFQISNYEEGIKKIHAAGIHVVGAFVVGFDGDTIETFEHIYDFSIKNNLSYIMLNILTVFYGTALYEEMKKLNRLINVKPEYLNGLFPTMKYKNMNAREIYNKYFETLEKLYSFDLLHKKSLELFKSGSFNKQKKSGVRLIEKIRGVILIFKTFVFTSDKTKRQFFLDMMELQKKNIVPMETIVEHLFFMIAANIYVKNHRKNQGDIFEKFIEQNKLTSRDLESHSPIKLEVKS